MRAQRTILAAVAALAALMLLASGRADASDSYFAAQCTTCHPDDTATCDGCHPHVVGGLHATTDKAVYAPGETITVIFDSWDWGGWARGLLYDQGGVELDRITGPTGMGDDGTPDPRLQFPMVLHGSAPLTQGTYTWYAAWFGSSGTPGEEYNHVEERVPTNEFQVQGAPVTTTTNPPPPTTTTQPSATTTTTRISTTTTTVQATTTTTAPPPTSTTTTPNSTTTSTTLPPPVAGLDHFLCYKTLTRQQVSVRLSDQFDTATYSGSIGKLLCTPANKNNEGVLDPDTHLTGYRIAGPHARTTRQTVVNQFGTFLFDTLKTDSLLVPTAKSVAPAPPPGLPNPDSAVDHYRCLKAKISPKTTPFPRTVQAMVEDQFGRRIAYVKKPLKLCVATDKNGEGIKNPNVHLMCYRIKVDFRHSVSDVQINNQFGAATVDLRTESELCVPSFLGQAPVTTTTGGASTTTTSTTTSTTTTTLPGVPTVTITVTGTPAPGNDLTGTANITLPSGCTLQTVAWSETAGVPVDITNGDTASATIGLPASGIFKEELIALLSEPPIPLAPGEEFYGGLQDRFQVVAINNLALEEAGLVGLKVDVSTSCGGAAATKNVNVTLPWPTWGGVRDVPIGIPVILHGKGPHCSVSTTTACAADADCPTSETCVDIGRVYDWAMTRPASSTATIVDPTSQNPDFTPDVVGLYTLTVTDTSKNPPAAVSLPIYADNWRGAITGQDATGLLASACTVCHKAGGSAPDNFTPWKQTGHANIFSGNLNTSTHYGESCFACHTVGFNKSVVNNGMDDASDYASFLGAGLLNNPNPNNWTTMLASYPQSARRANIQCENCHGPQNGGVGHINKATEPRISLSSDVCGACHGEPTRHARYQQWQISGHGNYELAIGEGTNANCARCHSVNGFLAWEDLSFDQATNVTVSWTADDVHPQTCVTCHDPHAEGTSEDTPVRVQGDTPLLAAGFTATGVGRGAVCMICHNSRRGLHNDGNFASIKGTSNTASAPHVPKQADMLMGQNAYLVPVGTPGSHAMITDTCAECHMVQTKPPAELSNNFGGTNHTFTADPTICANDACHGPGFTADMVQAPFDADYAQLQLLLGQKIQELIADQIAAGNVVVLDKGGGVKKTISDAGTIQSVAFGESHGAQAITVTFTDTTVFGPVSLKSVTVRDAANPANCAPGAPYAGRCELYDYAADGLIKAAWNYFIVEDGSRGVHNNAFISAVLANSIAALNAIP